MALQDPRVSQHSRTHRWNTVLERDSIFLSPLPLLLPELLPKGSKEEQRDYVFYLAVGNYRLKVRPQGPAQIPPHPPGQREPWPSLSQQRAAGWGDGGCME